jgi:hypothetical protein
MRRNALLAFFFFVTITCGFVAAYWGLLPMDTSALPLGAITASQSCLVGLWLVHRSQTWLGRILIPTGLVSLNFTLGWAANGLHVPANVLWLSVYALNAVVPLGAVTFCELLLRRTTKRAEIESQNNMRFSVADLLYVTTMCAVGILAVMLWPPSLNQYQYTYGIGDSSQQLIALNLPTVIATLVVFRITQSPVLRIPALSSTILCTLIVGILTASLLGINANPLWGAYALMPSLTSVLVTFALLIHRHAGTQRQYNMQAVDSRDDRPNNHAMHRSGGGKPFLKLMSISATR